jgi:hypothetical protein
MTIIRQNTVESLKSGEHIYLIVDLKKDRLNPDFQLRSFTNTLGIVELTVTMIENGSVATLANRETNPGVIIKITNDDVFYRELTDAQAELERLSSIPHEKDFAKDMDIDKVFSNAMRAAKKILSTYECEE